MALTLLLEMTLDEFRAYMRPRFARITELELAKVAERIARLEAQADETESR